MTFRTSITWKIGLLTLVGTGLVLALALERSYTCSRKLIQAGAEQNARELTRSLANEIEQEFLVVSAAAKNMAVFLSSVDLDEELLLTEIRHMVEHNAKVFGSTVAFEPGAMLPDRSQFAPYYYKTRGGIAYEQLGTDSYNYFDKKWYRIAREKRAPTWSQPYFDEGGGEVVMTTYSHPLLYPDSSERRGQVRAIVTADISLEDLTRTVNSKQVFDTGYCLIVSDTGVFVTHPDPGKVMHDTIFCAARRHDDPKLELLASAIISEESGFSDIGSSLTGKPSYLSFTRISPPGWSLLAVFPKDELFAPLRDLHQDIVTITAVGVVLLLIVSIALAKSISRPLRTMAAAANRIAEGDLEQDLSAIRSADEVGQLASAFTKMTEGLKERDRIRDTFGRYVTQEVVKRLLDSRDGLKLGGEVRDISLIMSDLRGFTAMTATLEAEEVITFLNRYLGKMVEIILDHHGIIDEIIGDGILAFFGAPEKLDNHPELAVSCALRMQAAMDEINALNEADGLPHLEMGIAVNTGKVVVGNIGSEKRAKYGAVGQEINVTGRTESCAVGGQTLLTQSTYDRLSSKLDIRQVLEVEMKGVPGKVKLYHVIGLRGDYEVRVEPREHALKTLAPPVEVRLRRINRKVVDTECIEAQLVLVSLSGARVMTGTELVLWEDLRLTLSEQVVQDRGAHAHIYCKVVSVERVPEVWLADLTFTSVSASAQEFLRLKTTCGDAQ